MLFLNASPPFVFINAINECDGKNAFHSRGIFHFKHILWRKVGLTRESEKCCWKGRDIFRVVILPSMYLCVCMCVVIVLVVLVVIIVVYLIVRLPITGESTVVCVCVCVCLFNLSICEKTNLSANLKMIQCAFNGIDL